MQQTAVHNNTSLQQNIGHRLLYCSISELSTIVLSCIVLAFAKRSASPAAGAAVTQTRTRSKFAHEVAVGHSVHQQYV